ncbi:MAG: alpha/beta fold hydrolase [Pseudomonadales bacterium]|nr:alpha/beta fold hydrolase [Pseudomonadales bacterium]
MKRQAGWLGTPTPSTFVQYHLPSDAETQSGTGVIIVPSPGHEYFHGYRALRVTADTLAADGHAVVRLDLRGVGNALDPEPGTGTFSAWLEDIERARTHLIREHGIQRIALVGHRLGALLAARAAQPSDLLALWAVPASGRHFLREIKALAMTGGARPGSALESGGMLYDDVLQDVIASLDLRTLPISCRNILLIDRQDRPLDTAVADTLLKNHPDMSRIVDSDYSTCFREPHDTTIAVQTIARITAWIAACRAPDAQTGPAVAVESKLWSKVFLPDGGRERVLRVHGLFAVQCQAPGNSTVLLLSNAGAVHHVGPNRLYVRLARQLAGAGIDTLRYDFRNLGESVCQPIPDDNNHALNASEENHPYPSSARDDVDLVLRWATESGYTRIVIGGLCSGGYAAFDYMRSHPSGGNAPEIMLINPLTFQWRDGMSLDIPAEYAVIRQKRAYQSAVKDPRRWLRFFKGDMDYGLMLRYLADSVLMRITTKLTWLARILRLVPPPPLARDLRAIAQSGSLIRCYFSTSDPGYDILLTAGRSLLNRLQRSGQLVVRHIADADHTFKRAHKRDELVGAIVEDLTHGHPGTDA